RALFPDPLAPVSRQHTPEYRQRVTARQKWPAPASTVNTTRSPRFGDCPRRIESENDTPRRRLGPETPAKNRCHSASTRWYGDSNVLQALFRTSAAPTRCVAERSERITRTVVQVGPRGG